MTPKPSNEVIRRISGVPSISRISSLSGQNNNRYKKIKFFANLGSLQGIDRRRKVRVPQRMAVGRDLVYFVMSFDLAGDAFKVIAV